MNVAGPPTPTRVHSPMAHSLVKANASVDELEHALAGFSRAHSPEPAQALACCGAHDQDQCAHLRAWTAVKARLESRLTLSARACAPPAIGAPRLTDGAQRSDRRC
jgi:hypothetical protein